ncbi:hypothetical protein SEUCBS140593_008957 [Sporothrix eucalyptigena]|uniref:Dihydrodipicolinate synthetase family protein n=1 Tax=Sporothrix eucalyptigena TaxID=1812306 RepID=A0ABP0CQU2_9PEZI
MTTAGKPFPPGIHAPCLAWFGDDVSQEIDWELQTKHIEYIIGSGIHGIILAGTNGEAVALTATEKEKLVKVTVDAAQRLGRPDVTITMGCGGQSTRDVIAETKLAKAAGAEFALVLVPSYFHFAMTDAAIVAFFEELADASPIPVVIYNFPTVAAGLDCNTDVLSQLGKHPNIVGVKLTCGGIAKVARIADEFSPEKFSAVAGQSDWLVPALTVGGTGAVTGVGNLYPKFCVQMYDLYKAGKLKEAEAAQLRLAQMEWGFAKGGINGTKWAVGKFLGYATEKRHCRRPYPQFVDVAKQEWISKVVEPLLADEKRLNSSPLLQQGGKY